MSAAAMALAVLGLSTLPAHAQTDDTSLNLTTSPLPVNLVTTPGKSIQTTLEIKNGGDKTETLKVGLLKFSAYGEAGKPDLRDREPGDDYFDWVTFSENQFTIAPDTWHKITMTIDVPSTAALGYYYAVTFSRLDPPKSAATNKLQGGTAILVLLEARVPNARRELRIEDFSATKRIYEFLPATFNVKFKNTGNIHLPVTGNIFIKRGEKVLEVLSINSTGGNILPDTQRIFSGEWRDGFPVYEPLVKDGKVQIKDSEQQYHLKWDISKISRLRLGRYTAQLSMIYDDGERDVPMEAILTFWVIPWRLIFFALLPLTAFGLITFGYVRMRRRYKKLKDSQT